MNINRINNNNIINYYNKNKKVENINKTETKSDSLVISSVGKSLSSYSVDSKFTNPDDKIEALRNEISKGTYKSDSKLTARKMMDLIKDREV